VAPLPPLGTILVANPLPLALAPEGFATEHGLFLWEAAPALEVANKKLRLNSRITCLCGSNAHAASLARELRKLSKLKAEARAAAIRALLRRNLDVKEVRERLEDLKQGCTWLRRLCVSLWTFVFVAAPLIVFWRGLGQTWGALLAGVFAFTVPIAIVFRREHRKRHLAAEDERFSLFLTFLLSPASAIRGVDGLSRAQLAAFHPLAVARLLCDDDAFGELAARAAREARFPPPGGARDAATGIREFAATAWREVLEEWLRAQKFDVEPGFRPPVRTDEASRSYCPRCLAQFTTPAGACGDCGGVALKPLA
jgi:hypothetical protein